MSQSSTGLHKFKLLTEITEKKNVQQKCVREPQTDFTIIYNNFLPGVRDVWEKIQTHLYKKFQKGSIDKGLLRGEGRLPVLTVLT